MKKSIEFLKNYLIDNDTVICACSGGPDSMVLINLLIKIREEKCIKIICAHVNHSLREESEEEYEFVKEFCKSNKITFEGIKLSNYGKDNIEATARKKRYSFFEDLVNKYNAKYLLTAHHGDDLVETILMKLTRGSSLDGYIGFDYVVEKNNYTILRPLVFYTKKDVESYAQENNIEFRIDKTNFDKKYTRNRYRMNVLPLLKEEDPNIHLKYLKFSDELKQSNKFIQNYITKKYDQVCKNKVINIDLLLLEDKFIIKNIIYKFLKSIYKSSINYIESKHIDYVMSLLYTNKPNVSIDLPLDITVEKKYNCICLKNNFKTNEYCIELNEEVKTPNGVIKVVKETDLTNNYVCFLNTKEIKLPIYVRNKREGDYIELLGLNKSKKIKDIFINEKVDVEKRQNYPLVVDSLGNVLWLPGIKKSKYDNIKTGKYDIILRYDEEE